MQNVFLKCTSGGLRLRESPSTGKPIGSLALDERVQSLESGDETKAKVGKIGQWLKVRRLNDNTEGYTAAWFLVVVSSATATSTQTAAAVIPDTSPVPPAVKSAAVSRLYVRPLEDGIRIRKQPRDGEAIGAVNTLTVLESLETPEATRAKLGVTGEWLNVRLLTGVEGYVAAWFVKETAAPISILSAKGVNTVGMNLDQFHPQGTPEPERFKGLGWVRFGYNVSMGKGNQDLEAAFKVYAPLAERYAKVGLKVMFVFTHQTYGEGRDEFWPWSSMTDEKWRKLTEKFTEMVGHIVRQFAPLGTVACWQVWNEQDAPIGAAASVPMSPQNYAHLLGRTLQVIRAADPNVSVITGGHTGGPGPGSTYAAKTIQALRAAMPGVLPDGIATHPYGRGARPGTRYANFGDLREELNAYAAVLSDRPVWISEWGALDKEGDPAGDVAQYASEFVELINREYPNKVAALIWYAWAMGMHNGYGLVGRDNRPIADFYETFIALRG